MKSRNTNKIGIQWVCWLYSQGICHDARSYDIQTDRRAFPSHFVLFDWVVSTMDLLEGNWKSRLRISMTALNNRQIRVQFGSSQDHSSAKFRSIYRVCYCQGFKINLLVRKNLQSQHKGQPIILHQLKNVFCSPCSLLSAIPMLSHRDIRYDTNEVRPLGHPHYSVLT
jgi:hypothetical protein